MLNSSVIIAAVRKPADRNNPEAQIRGSALGYFCFSFVLKREPRGTPTIPESIVTTPKIKETLKGKIRIH